MTQGFILQDYSSESGFTTWLAFLETARTRPKMNHVKVIAAFKERFGRAPEVARYLPGHWRAGPISQQKEITNEERFDNNSISGDDDHIPVQRNRIVFLGIAGDYHSDDWRLP